MTNAKNNKGRNLALGAVIIGLVGYVAGILTAPKSGKETRKDIQQKAARAKTEAEKKLKALHSELNELMAAARKNAQNVKSSVAGDLTEALAVAQTARKKAREMLSAVHEGDADDKDLQKAITEVKSAIDHLKKFVTKDISKDVPAKK
ncbi:MAG TPA: YtxH domain-containing protein [Candidatus Limnocylindria bacterium]|nr:YtxH domain-containing protein [Candidatus Limnocylindria bacterium]